MDTNSLMAVLNNCEVRLCYGCGEAYNASDFQDYMNNHECKKPFSKKKSFMKLKKGNMKPLNTNKIINLDTVLPKEIDD